MRVLLSAYVCEPGGASENKDGWLWARTLARRCELTLLTDTLFRPAVEAEVSRWPAPRPRRVYLDVSGHRPRLHRLLDVFPHYYAWQRRALAVARTLHDRDPFDVVHHVTYGSHRLPTYLGRLDVPLLWGPLGGGEHVPWRFAAPHWLGYAQASREAARYAWNGACRIDPRLVETARQAAVIAVATRESLVPFPRDTHHKGVVMAKTAVDADELRRLGQIPARAARPTGLSVVFTGRLLGWKGPTFALHAFARYAGQFPGAELHVYGDGPLRGRLERDAVRLAVGDRVRFHGQVGRAALVDAYRHHDVFLFPSLHDSYPAVVIEAMAAGMPVVYLAAGGTGEIVPEGAGVRVPAHAPGQAVAGLAAGLGALTRDPAAHERAAARARAHALDRRATPTFGDMADRLYGAAGMRLAPAPTV